MSNSFPAAYSQMPIQDLVAAPLTAAANANMALANNLLEFVEKLGFSDDSGKTSARTVDFTVTRPVEGSASSRDIPYTIPLLSLVPIPSLLIEDVSVDFQMEVTEVETTKQTTNTSATTSASVSTSGLFSLFKADFKVNGRVTTSRENTSSVNQSAKYQIHVNARQQPMTQGMNVLLQILASSMDPLPADSSAVKSS